VGIIDHGRMLASGRPDELLDALHSSVRVHVKLPAQGVDSRLDEIDEIAEIEEQEGSDLRLTVRRARSEAPPEMLRRLATLCERLSAAGADLVSIETKEHNLEELFLELTGRNLRE